MSGQEQLPGGSGSLLSSLRQRLQAKHALIASAHQQAEDNAGEDAQQCLIEGQHEEEQEDRSKHNWHSNYQFSWATCCCDLFARLDWQ
jgi:hypothetical protein